jgi:hypothetical protein
MQNMVDLPEPSYRAKSSSARCIEEIMRDRHEAHEYLFAPGQPRLGHFYLPPFQRPPKWTRTQAARLIESIHLDISIGSIVVSDCGDTTRTMVEGELVERFPDSADWLIDGQQRLRAIRSYLDDELVVFEGTPHEHRYSDLSKVQKRRFMGKSVGYVVLQPMGVEELARVYDLMNFGGTPHEEHERASGQATG